MHRRRRFIAAVGAVAASVLVGLQDTPAQATGGTGLIVDGDGVDYDAGCVTTGPRVGGAPAPDSIVSPNGSGCDTASIYDGSTESSDIRSMSLESTSTGRLKATMTVDGAIPAPGSTNAAALDGIGSNSTFGKYWVMFQNKDKQTGHDNPGSGCATEFNARVTDTHGHWADGYQFFLLYEVEYRAGRWIHSMSVGELETDTPYGYFPWEIARNDGSGWTTTQPAMAGRWSTSLTGSGPTTIDMEVTGRVHLSYPCVGGYRVLDLASNVPGPFSGPGYTGDTIANVKGLTEIAEGVGPAVEPIGWNGVMSFGGFSDVTAGHSTPGALNTNIAGVSVTPGAIHVGQENFANGPYCHFYLYITRVGNPLRQFQPNQPCQIDDDEIDRGTVNPEYWETDYGFTF